ncbi:MULTISPECIES: hypothetical protein [unclassified Breznakia]|uniref:RDAC family protein n=1 Tax=unclassified Breznakia TaxID=2623764 RepID=UPI0024748563|nr:MULTISPECIES: hypothetical protein [unclassified Breznakia]MDH6368008.1 hypothetical protein [Breznakia sp. PH1-1]MDH6405106.1 hypothetical protein [Breznakia sp. PF1-11]MDH6412811.1 hypothetical protein [Breznakia sp. PFB1-11]MDH6415171.1 hypothetical protein [Breznakia sp. PFB1-14]MDH6417482.1 hypothetical protein [Breznakia sp. PFB1-4]
MAKIVDVNKIFEINKLLKEKGIAYSLHSVGACGAEFVELKQDGEAHDVNELYTIINAYLKDFFMQVEPVKPGALLLKVV